MYPQGQGPVDLDNRLRLDAFLVAHGARVVGSLAAPIPGVRRELAQWLVAGVRANAKALGTLNWLAMEAERPWSARSWTPDSARTSASRP